MIYLVEDDANIRELVTYTLNHSGLDATGFERPSQFWKAMEGSCPTWCCWTSCCPKRTA